MAVTLSEKKRNTLVGSLMFEKMNVGMFKMVSWLNGIDFVDGSKRLQFVSN